MKDGVREVWNSKMAISATPPHSKTKIKWERGRSPGWAALQGTEPKIFSDHPSISKGITYVNGSSSSAKSFSSVLQPSVDSPTLTSHRNNFGSQKTVANSSKSLGNEVEKKQIIITDIDVNNNFFKASTVLQTMVSSGSSEETTSTNLAKNRSLDHPNSDMQREQPHKGFPLEERTEIMDPAGLSVTPEERLLDQKTDETGKGIDETKLSESTVGVKLIPKHLISPPVEPEWEQDDIYWCHRKDARRAIRSASQHSRAANNAYLRGDHCSAQQLSIKAQGDWMAAERLNSKAAQELLSIRNSNNDVWKLDLHGLHSSEAVHALQKHLWRIETQIPLNRSVPSNRIVKPKADSPVESGSCLGMEARTDKEQAMPSQRSTILQVITGIGNHSRGQATLPVVVRSFLIKNGYCFDESRPGVIAVRPKFRQP